jgi:hypothetical protein
LENVGDSTLRSRIYVLCAGSTTFLRGPTREDLEASQFAAFALLAPVGLMWQVSRYHVTPRLGFLPAIQRFFTAHPSRLDQSINSIAIHNTTDCIGCTSISANNYSTALVTARLTASGASSLPASGLSIKMWHTMCTTLRRPDQPN